MSDSRDVTAGLYDPDYLGDGVYVGHDGYQIWLRTDRGHAVHEIALDPSVFTSLLAYRDRITNDNPPG